MTIRKIIVFIGFSICCICHTSCKDKVYKIDESIPVISWKDFPKISLIKQSIYPLQNARFPSRLTIIPELNILLVIDIADTSQYWGKMYSLDSMRYLGPFAKKGNGVGEVIRVFQVQYNHKNKELYLLDPLGKRIVIYDLSGFGANRIVYKRTIRQKSSDSLRLNLTRTLVLGNGDRLVDVNLNKKGEPPRMLCFYDSSLRIHKRTVLFPITDTLPGYVLNYFADGGLNISDDQEMLILCHYNTDLLSLMDTSGKLVYSVRGPNAADFSFRIQHVTDNSLRVLPSKGSHQSYIARPRMNDRQILVLYDGRLVDDQDFHTRTLLVYDNHLRFIANMTLDEDVYDFDVDWSQRIIYCLNKKKQASIISYKF